MMRKKDVADSHDLQIYMEEQTKNCVRLYHYTTYENLLCILKNRCFRLSRMDLLNDKAEQSLGVHDEHLKNYVMSFTGEKEYISMWAMYGKASGIKIRIDFPFESFKKCINNEFYFDLQKKNKIPLSSPNVTGCFSKKGFLLSPVVYIDKNTKVLSHNGNAFQGIPSTNSSDIITSMSGFIKYDAWEFEKEIRLRALLYDGLGSFPTQSPKYIFVSIDDNLIKQIKVTFNPWLSSELKNEIQKSINGMFPYEIDCIDSQHDGEVSEL